MKNHSYVYERSYLAFIRGLSCARSGDWRAASIFYYDALRWKPDDVFFFIAAGAAPLIAFEYGGDAMRASEHSLKLSRNAWSVCIAAGVLHQHATQNMGSLTRKDATKFIELMRESSDLYTQLPDVVRQNRRLDEYYNVCRLSADKLKSYIPDVEILSTTEEPLKGWDSELLNRGTRGFVQREESLISESVRLAN